MNHADKHNQLTVTQPTSPLQHRHNEPRWQTQPTHCHTAYKSFTTPSRHCNIYVHSAFYMLLCR